MEADKTKFWTTPLKMQIMKVYVASVSFVHTMKPTQGTGSKNKLQELAKISSQTFYTLQQKQNQSKM